MKSGYKQTEVGVIPEDWEVKRLGELAPIATGNTPPTNDPSNYGDEFLFVGPVDMGENKFISRTEKMLSRKGFSIARKFPADSILFVSIGSTIGKCGIAPVDLTSNQQINAIFPSAKFSVDYLFYAVSAAASRIKSQAGEQAVPIVNKTQFAESIVPVPPLPEQRAIAGALSEVDALLGAQEALLAKKRDLKQAAMQQLLTGQKRLPSFTGEWQVKRLGEVAEIRSGGTPSTIEPRFWDGEVPWCTPTDITALNGHKYLGETSRTITELGLKASSAEMIPPHSVVMTSRATIGECAINVVPVSTNQGFKNFIPTAATDVHFLYYLLGTQKQGFISLCGGSTFLEIGKTQLTAYKVEIPSSKAEQTAIAAVLSDMDAEIAALEAQRDKTRTLKQGMMQELLTGRIRLV